MRKFVQWNEVTEVPVPLREQYLMLKRSRSGTGTFAESVVHMNDFDTLWNNSL